ncbi:MAG: hypothetical protein ABFC96_01495 [Thermoguttaceae bacterium]
MTTMSRFRRIAGSLAVVLFAYWAYALMAVPWIEPAAKPGSRGPQDEPRRNFGDPQAELLKKLFPADAWERKNPTVLESNRAKLIFQNYKNHPDGRIEITPCAIVFPYDGDAKDEAQRIRQYIILEAPGGAVLQFDPPLDLTRPKIGRLVGGRLVGQITIHSDWKEPGPDDDLMLVTRDVELSDQTAFTPYPVEFRWGPHFGRGREMTIKLLAGPPDPHGAGPTFAGVESFELRHIDRLHLDFGQAGPAASTTKQASVPVEIHCCGPFRFDVPRHVATFRDSVEVVKQNPAGPADQIVCELLSLFFADRKMAPQRVAGGGAGRRTPSAPPAGPAAQPGSDSLNLVAERFEARGNPAIVTAPSQKNLTARAPRIEYNLLSESIALDGAQEVSLQQGVNEIRARSLSYVSAGRDRLGRVLALGPGWLRGQSDDHPDQRLEAVWTDELRVEPDGDKHLVLLTGGAMLSAPGTGQLQSREIRFWLNESPPQVAGAKAQLQPDRLVARNDVHMNSPQLSGEVEQLDVRFQTPRLELPAQTPGGADPGPTLQSPYHRGLVASPPSNPTAPGAPSASGKQRFHVNGRTLNVDVLLNGREPSVTRLVIDEGVRFEEEPSGEPGRQQPMRILGDRLELADATGPNAVAVVTGQRAHIEARGLSLTGSNVHLDRGANRLWIEGPGEMDLPLPASANQPAAGPIAITWQKGMMFDGQVATFEDSVVAAIGGQPPRQQVRARTMTAELLRRISFSEQRPQEPQLATIGCQGGVWLENCSYDAQGQLTARDQVQLANVCVNIRSGETVAEGPGWLHSVRRGSANLLPGSGATDRRAAPAAPAPSQLICLHVTFERSVKGTLPIPAAPGGNAPLLYLTFADQVKAGYASVNDWDANIPIDDPAKLGPTGMTARCDQLSVAETSLPGAATHTGEIVAFGAAKVEGSTLSPRGTYTAHGNRISYDEAKGLLILEGDGRTNADVLWQSQLGAEPTRTPAQKMLYWPKTHTMRIERGGAFGTNQLPGTN